MENNRSVKLIAKSLFYSLGFMGFAFFVHSPFPWLLIAIIALSIPMIIIFRQLHSISDIRVMFGISWGEQPALHFLIGILLGLMVALFYRNHQNLPLFIPNLTWFALVAMLIGSTEELLFRGFLQGRLQKVNPIMAVVFTSVAHSGYKLCLFLSPFVQNEINLAFLFSWTFGIGILFGVLKESSKSVIPVMLAHALFDILVYGYATNAPWWVW